VTRCGSAQEFIERFSRFTTETHVVVPALPRVSVGAVGSFSIRLKDQSVMMQGRCEVTEIRPVTQPAGAAPAALPSALMSLRLLEMDAHSWGIHLRLMERHAPSGPPPVSPPKEQGAPARSLSLVPPLPVAPSTRTEAPAVAAPSSPVVSTMQVMSIPRLPPRPSPSAPLAMQAAQARAAGAAALATAPQPALAPQPAPAPQPEAAEVPSLPPRPEARAAGADFTLPANPLSDLDAADLSGFIDLTLLETASQDQASIAPPTPPRADRAAARLDRARRIARRAAPYASCVLVGVLLGIALKPGPKMTRVPAAPAATRPAGAASPLPAAPPPATLRPSARDCTARVTTKPAGAVVFWGDLAIGSSPIESAAIPCGTAVVTFRRERYAEATQTITTEPGQGAVISERLYRPPAKLEVTSSPAHALIKLNNHRLGPAPRKINTLRFEHLRISASLPGYRPWKKTLYLKEAESKLDVTLVPLPRTAARRAQ
jgi:hypothetical protein